VRKLILLFTLALLLLSWLVHAAATVVDLRPRIDGTSEYSNADSLEFTDVGGAGYDGYSDTIYISGAEFVSVDFLLTRNGKATAACYIQLQGSKDLSSWVNTDVYGDSIPITKASSSIATTITFVRAPIYTYYRVFVNNDTLFSAMTKWKVGGRTNAR
jgi:hypothetical protein